MFQFPRFPSIRYGFAYGCMRSAHAGFPIRISPDQRLFAPPRSFSQLTASFIGSQCQGIHPVLLLLDLLKVHRSASVRIGFCVYWFISDSFISNDFAIVVAWFVTSATYVSDASDVFSLSYVINAWILIISVCGFQGTYLTDSLSVIRKHNLCCIFWSLVKPEIYSH